MMGEYKYFVSYMFNGGGGNSVIEYWKAIDNEEDIKHLQAFLKEKNHPEMIRGEPIILSFQLISHTPETKEQPE